MNRSELMTFVGQIENTVSDLSCRTKVAAAAIAVAVAQTRHLPSAPVISGPAYYIEQVLPKVMDIVSQFNEVVVIDTGGCLEMIRQFWMVRYTAAHPATLPVFQPNTCFFDMLTGVNVQVSEELQCFLNDAEKAKMVMCLMPFAADLIASLGSDFGGF